MRLIEPGDVILHLIDNGSISGISIAADRAKLGFIGLPGTDWADRQCYRIDLRDYVELSPPLHRNQFLDNREVGDELKEIRSAPREGIL